MSGTPGGARRAGSNRAASTPAAHRAQKHPPGRTVGRHAARPSRAPVPTTGRHLVRRETGTPAFARIGLAAMVTAVAMGGVSLAEGGSMAAAGATSDVTVSAAPAGSAPLADPDPRTRETPVAAHAPAPASDAGRHTSARAEPTDAAAGRHRAGLRVQPASREGTTARSTTGTPPRLPAAARTTAAGRHTAAKHRAPREPVIEALPGCPAPRHTDHFPNGLIPRADLCRIPGTGQLLRTDATAAWVALSEAYHREFGTDPVMTDSYRGLAVQKRLFKTKPHLAARPGTSQHGLGIAVDLGGGIEQYRSRQHAWMQQHAAAYGWTNPAWARPGGSKFEPWHWEYAGRG